MRDFVDGILQSIGTESLTDEEFGWITIQTQAYTAELYTEILGVLDAREAVSNTRDRLKYFFMSKGVAVTTPAAGSSKIYLGDDLCS